MQLWVIEQRFYSSRNQWYQHGNKPALDLIRQQRYGINIVQLETRYVLTLTAYHLLIIIQTIIYIIIQIDSQIPILINN